MGLILHSNSWVTIAEADTYLLDRIGASAWSISTEKAALLITAFHKIYASPDYNIPKTSINERVKWAQIELALWLLKHNDDLEVREALQIMGVTSAKADDTQENYNCKFLLPVNVSGLLSGFLTASCIATVKREVQNFL